MSIRNYILILLVFIGCKKDAVPPVSPLDQRFELISKTWVLGGNDVIKDGIDVSDEFVGFTITLSNSFNYSTIGGGGVWPVSGTWAFGGTTENPNLDKIIRNDGVEITIVSISESGLVLSFFFVDNSGGRGSGLDGNYIFNLSRQ